MDNEVNLIRANELPIQNDNDEKKSLDDLDISRLLIIKNPNNELAIGTF